MQRRLFLVNVVPVLFLLANTYVWWTATPLDFQRFGSVGVMLAAMMFGFDRMWRNQSKTRPEAREGLIQTEIWLIAISTLQWGYGDLFHCWSHGNGWRVCA